MHWLRIDRYYSSDMTEEVAHEKGIGAIDKFTAMEAASENPQISFQPIMCQHCNHAPCETVCPVAATTHSLEGLNMIAYNRCVGTRYCANNCPYKVRRFNWFKYSDNEQFDFNMNDDLGKMVLNPDVVVRSRGVIEKCTMCVQQIQAGKLTVKKEGRKLKDGDIQTACASACPTHAITFGDLNDETTLVHQFSKEPRSYVLLEEVGTQPNVYYQTKVRNVKESA
jgi:molybdopterin-containing oxidoreductase family iron-sulfur binding subunit